MILTEPTPDSPLKARQAALDSEQGQSSAEQPLQSPPAYTRYGSNPLPVAPARGQSPARRFFEAFCVAVVLYLLVGMLTSSMVRISASGDRHRRTGPIRDSPAQPVPADGRTIRCVEGDEWVFPESEPESHLLYRANTQFEYPLSSNVLYLFSRGQLAYGSVSVVDWVDGGDNIKIDILASYYSQEALGRFNVCMMSRKDGENGIGIFTSQKGKRDSTQDRIEFTVLIHDPVLHRSSALIRSFETDMPLFAHKFIFQNRVDFGSLSVRGSSMPISATNLFADNAMLETTDGGISGYFNTSTSLELHTSNAPIMVTVGLHNDPKGSPTKLIMKTSNGPIDSVLSLSSSQITKGSYNVNTETSNNKLNVDYSVSPVNSTLVHYARTSNSPATLNLHKSYEGTFSVESSNITPSVEYDDRIQDPSGKGRKRRVEVLRVKQSITGTVYWWAGKKLEQRGNVDIITSNSPAKLTLL